MKTKTLCLICLILTFAGTAGAQLPCTPTGSGICRYVSATGSDSNNGLTRGAPKQNIAVTANASNPGDEIIVLAGVYNCASQPAVSSCTSGMGGGAKLVNVTASGTAADPIVIVCDSYLACQIDGTNNSTATGFEMAGSYITVKNFEIEGFADNGWENWNGGTNVTVTRNWIHDIGRECTTTTTGHNGLFVRYSVTITQNIVSDIGRLDTGEAGCGSTLANHDHGVYIDLGPTTVMIANNIFYRNSRGWGVQIYNGSSTDISILNNTFIWSDMRSGASGGQIVIDASVTNLLIENNIGYQPKSWFVNAMSGVTVGGTIANNVVYGTSSVSNTLPGGYTMSVTGNILPSDPLLVSVGTEPMDTAPSTPDAHLASASSPAKGAGLTLAQVPVDFDGAARSGAYDIGAYIYAAAATGRGMQHRLGGGRKVQ